MKVLVTGADGLLGRAIQDVVRTHASDLNVYFASREVADLLDRQSTFELLERVSPDAVVHTAALVGGIGGNISRPFEYFSKNLVLNQNVIEAALSARVSRFVGFLSTCIFPHSTSYPLSSQNLHEGPPHDSNFGYAHSKRALEVGLRAALAQHGLKYDLVTLSNLYGPNDNFDLENGHVIPSLIHKFYLAHQRGTLPQVWGDGTPLREFTYVRDVATSVLALLRLEPRNESFILSNPSEVSIRELAYSIDALLGGRGEINFLTDRPSGQLRKPSSPDELGGLKGQVKFTPLQTGLHETVSWFLSKYPEIRGVNKNEN